MSAPVEEPVDRMMLDEEGAVAMEKRMETGGPCVALANWMRCIT